MSGMLGKGVYSLAEVAQLTGLKRARVGEWFRGRPSEASPRPLFRSDYQPVEDDVAVSFLDLIDVFVAGQLREHGVPLQAVRRVYSRLTEDLETHPPPVQPQGTPQRRQGGVPAGAG